MGFGSFVTRCWVGVNNVLGGGVRIPLGRGLCWGEQLLRHSHHCLSPQMSGGPCKPEKAEEILFSVKSGKVTKNELR